LLWIVCAVTFISTPGLCWGPGVHIETSLYILESLLLIAPFARKIIQAYPYAFIYGSVAPDMVFGKRYMTHERNNHNWDNGFRVFRMAEGDRQKSFALGYLTHLAADTVAHNMYVPDRMIDINDDRSHMMQELVFDAALDDQVWKIAQQVARKHYPECNRLLRKNLPRTPLPKIVNQELFRSGVLLVRFGGWERIIRRLKSRWSDDIAPCEIDRYLSRSHKAAIEILNNSIGVKCLKYCPTGKEILPAAMNIKDILDQTDEIDEEVYDDLVDTFHDFRKVCASDGVSKTSWKSYESDRCSI
jgi:zinc dependent phospholipase C